MTRNQFLALAGSLILIAGVFAPVVSVPIAGEKNYFETGRVDAFVLIALAILSFLLAMVRAYSWLWFSGLASLAVLIYTFAAFEIRVARMRADIEAELEGNPFKGLVDTALDAYQLQWGWAWLILGAFFVIIAAAMRTVKTPQRSGSSS